MKVKYKIAEDKRIQLLFGLLCDSFFAILKLLRLSLIYP